MTADALYIVYVHDAINAELAGHRGCAYRSPPQSHADALALVGLLLGSRARAAPAAAAKWTRSVAGGRRTITLTPAGPTPREQAPTCSLPVVPVGPPDSAGPPAEPAHAQRPGGE